MIEFQLKFMINGKISILISLFTRSVMVPCMECPGGRGGCGADNFPDILVGVCD